MEALPDAIVQYILSNISNAKDVASCSCVSKSWNDSVPYLKSLYFPRNLFDNLPKGFTPVAIISHMISSIVRLEQLIVYCPFTVAGLAFWLMQSGTSLRVLELRLDNVLEREPSSGSPSMVDCIGAAYNLECLRLWGMLMVNPPKWDTFHRLKNLEIVGGRMEDTAFSSALRACPNLISLSLLGCDGLKYVAIDLPYLKQCKLDFNGLGNGSLSVSAPNLELLEVQGCSWIRVPYSQCLNNLSIANNSGRVYMLDFGKLEALETLSMRGVQWSWDVISKMLQMASEVKHLFMKVEFTGDFEALLPFPEIDLVDFFNNHSKLQTLGIEGALFAALCQKNSLKNVDSKFMIPCLEKIVISVRSPLNAEQKMNTLESLAKYTKKLKKMSIKILQMKSSHSSADDFFEDIWRFKCINRRVVTIE
ncbi:hypothetical protein LIER_15696 [Lithospermum erythrorhizon]|uniref:F-box domain-containing protein n=1 Tax=Lithospermum erythrorhizon TaxID=34254 RepID=A0AAV3Q717_LITER